jgi:signal transduction histidine kinase
MLAKAQRRDGQKRDAWALAAGLAAGVGVWSTHFVAMTAYDVGLPIAFANGPLAASFALSLAAQTLVFWVLRSPPSTRLIVIAGFASGIGIAAMHYVGTNGLISPAEVVWTPSYVAVSLIVSLPIAIFSFVVFNYKNVRWRSLFAGSLFVVGICALHFTAMSALTLIPLPSSAISTGDVSRQMLGVLAGVGCLLIVAAGIAAASIDTILERRDNIEAILQQRVTERTAEILAFAEQETLLRRRAEAAYAAKSQFLTNMSHELRTPMNAIIGYSEMTLEDLVKLNSQPDMQDDVKRVIRSAKHLLSLIEEVLTFSKIESGRMNLFVKKVVVAPVLRQIIDAAKVSPGSSQPTVTLTVDDSVGTIRTDELKLRHCVMNLVSNACKFTPQNGRVDVQAATVATQTGSMLKITVSDTGMGIRREDLERIFEPFVQGDSSIRRLHGGTGLGLATTKKLAELLEGTLRVESEIGKGSTFTLIVNAELYLYDTDGTAIIAA